jgi:hypothetical protein
MPRSKKPARRSGKKSARRSGKKSARRSGKKSARRSGKKSARRSGKKSARRSGKKSARRSGKKSARRSVKKSARRSGKKSGNATRYHGLFDLVPEWLGGKHVDTDEENLLRVNIYNSIRKIWREYGNKTARAIELLKLLYSYNFKPPLEAYVPDASGKCKADSLEKKPAPYYVLKDIAKELYAADLVNEFKTIAEQIQKFPQFDKEAAEMRITLGIPTPLPSIPNKYGFDKEQERLWDEYRYQLRQYESIAEKYALSIPQELRKFIAYPSNESREYRPLDYDSIQILKSFTWANENMSTQDLAIRVEKKVKEMRENIDSRRKKFEDEKKRVVDIKDKLMTIEPAVAIKLGISFHILLLPFVARTDTKTDELILTVLGQEFWNAFSDLKGVQPLATEGLLSRSSNEIPNVPLNSFWRENTKEAVEMFFKRHDFIGTPRNDVYRNIRTLFPDKEWIEAVDGL